MRVLKFAGASGAGLALDFAVYTLLNELGMRPGWANLVSAACAVTLVFVLSAHSIFDGGQGWLGRLFLVYVVYQVVAIAMASVAVDAMSSVFGGAYFAGKLAVLPATFLANFAFMSWLLGGDARRPEIPAHG